MPETDRESGKSLGGLVEMVEGVTDDVMPDMLCSRQGPITDSALDKYLEHAPLTAPVTHQIVDSLGPPSVTSAPKPSSNEQ